MIEYKEHLLSWDRYSGMRDKWLVYAIDHGMNMSDNHF